VALDAAINGTTGRFRWVMRSELGGPAAGNLTWPCRCPSTQFSTISSFYGKPLTKARRARLLGRFGILSGTIRLPDDTTPKGYHLEAFGEAFASYLPDKNATTPQANNDGPCGAFQNATTAPPVALSKTPQANNDGGCGGVALSKPGTSK
jgi:Protein of unknown function (DUF3631)